MSTYRLVLQLTSALLVFATVLAPVTGSPQRLRKGRFPKVTKAPEPTEGPLEEISNADSAAIDEIKIIYETLEECLPEPLPLGVYFYYYTKKHPSGRVFNYDSPPTSDIFPSTSTKILTHGVKNSLNSTEIREVIEAYLSRNEEVNLLALDWSNYTKGMYRRSAKSAILIGKAISSIFCTLYKYYDIYPSQMHFIGYNVGAHLLAATARESASKVGRITGLDPARLCFEDRCHDLHLPLLSKSDAKFVDILHTDPGNYGVADSYGTADFYANYGKGQPSCHPFYQVNSPTCDSRTSVFYFAESIRKPFEFEISSCKSPYPVLACSSDPEEYWGEFMEVTIRGIFNIPVNESLLRV